MTAVTGGRSIFGGPRLPSPSVSREVCPDLQSILWGLVDRLRSRPGAEVGRVQRFDLRVVAAGPGAKIQQVVHTQNNPVHHRDVYWFPVSRPIDATLCAVDDGTVCWLVFDFELSGYGNND